MIISMDYRKKHDGKIVNSRLDLKFINFKFRWNELTKFNAFYVPKGKLVINLD